MLIKFCGLTRQEDCDAASDLGADFCGFVFHPASPRYLAPEKAASLRTGSAARVGVFTGLDAREIARIIRIARLDYAQLHGGQPESLGAALGVPIIRVLWPERHPCIREMLEYAQGLAAAFFLLDAGKSGGGSGNTLPFAELAGFSPPVPWLLAGGLNAANIPAALNLCRPAGLDINSGVETAPGLKDADKMALAWHAAKNG